jgi:hypothetical protein
VYVCVCVCVRARALVSIRARAHLTSLGNRCHMFYYYSTIAPFRELFDCPSYTSTTLELVFFIYNLNQQSEFTFYKLML